MKRIAGIVMVALAGCAANPSSDDTGPAARCSVTDCFNQSSIRSFEVLDDRTAVVYVGPQRCPFVVEVDGFNCQLTFTPELRFFQPIYGSSRATEKTGQICGSRDTLYVYTGVADPALTQGIGPLEGGPPATDTLGRRRDSFGDRLGSSRSPTSGVADVTVDTINNNEVCRVTDIRSITDDQLIELRVKQGAPPPPPVGQGRIQVPAGGAGQGQAAGGAQGQSSGEADGQSSGETGVQASGETGVQPSGEAGGQPSGAAERPPASSETDGPAQGE